MEIKIIIFCFYFIISAIANWQFWKLINKLKEEKSELQKKLDVLTQAYHSLIVEKKKNPIDISSNVKNKTVPAIEEKPIKKSNKPRKKPVIKN